MKTLQLQYTVDHDAAFRLELARLRADTGDEVMTARRRAIADVIERCHAAFYRTKNDRLPA